MSRELPDRQALEHHDASGGPAEADVHAMLVSEVGDAMAQSLARNRQAADRLYAEQHPDEGLRERKKRQTRQRISDVATALFVFRGFDAVRVSDVADVVGVSEKTLYNYFPTKEAMVFDMADDDVERVAAALRERKADESPTRAVLRAMLAGLDALTASDGLDLILPRFAEMIASTPSLRAAWLDIHARLVAVTADELAASADIDPRDPEPMIAARAIVGLQDVFYEQLVRHVRDGLAGSELRDAVVSDLERAARLLETGLWSFKLLAKGASAGKQLLDAKQAAEQARHEVVKAMKDARTAWRRLAREQADDLTRSTRDASRALRKDAERSASKIGRDARKSAREARKSLRYAHTLAELAAYDSLRDALRDGPSTKQPD